MGVAHPGLILTKAQTCAISLVNHSATFLF